MASAFLAINPSDLFEDAIWEARSTKFVDLMIFDFESSESSILLALMGKLEKSLIVRFWLKQI